MTHHAKFMVKYYVQLSQRKSLYVMKLLVIEQ